MSYTRKSLSLVLCLSLLATSRVCATEGQEPESIITGLCKFAAVSSFILVPFGLWHYYKNYYSVDRTSVESLLLSLEAQTAEAQELIALNLHESILNEYSYTAYPYIAYNAELADVIYNLYYHKNALTRKIAHKKFSDKNTISNISSLISQLERIQLAIEKSSEYKNERQNEKGTNTPKFGYAKLNGWDLEYYEDEAMTKKINYDKNK